MRSRKNVRGGRFCLSLRDYQFCLSAMGLIVLEGIFYGHLAMVQRLGEPAHFEFLWRILQWSLIVILLFLSFAALYRYGPN